MDLQEFIKETLLQIENGVREANKSLNETGAYVANTEFVYYDGCGYSFVRENDEYRKVTFIDFDVAVAVNQVSETNTGGHIKVMDYIQLGREHSKKGENQVVNRIKFQIPLVTSKCEHLNVVTNVSIN
jgi:hypothetical protein